MRGERASRAPRGAAVGVGPGLFGLLGVMIWMVDAPAHAYVCTQTSSDGPNLAWATRTVTLARSGLGDELNDPTVVEDTLAAAAASWSEVGCSDLELRIGSATSQRLVGFDWAAGSESPENQNILVFRNQTDGDPIDAWVHQLGALAITTVTFESNAGRLLDADVEINDVSFIFTACDDCAASFDLQNTLTHELGHVVGLDHSSDATATMFASAPRGDTSKRSLETDDADALCRVYPTGAPVGLCPGAGPREMPPDVRFTALGCSGVGGPSSGAGCAPLSLLALSLLRPARMGLFLRRRRP